MSNLQLTVGSSQPVLQLQFSKYAKWVDHSWLTSIWQCVSRINFLLHIKRLWVPTLQRTHDMMLTDHFPALKYKPKDLEILNKCHLYFQVLSLSDIVSADGKTVIPLILNGIRLTDRKRNLVWPNQQPPPLECLEIVGICPTFSTLRQLSY
jgi:hypothetical protein